MEENIFYSETKFIIETVIKTAVDVIRTPPKQNRTPEPNVRRQVRFALLHYALNCSSAVYFGSIQVKAVIPHIAKKNPKCGFN